MTTIDYKNWYYEYCKKYDFLKIRALIKGLALEGKILREYACRSEKDKRAQLRNKKKELGQYTRHIYLAYALIREVPYKVCENKCDELNKPKAKVIFEILESLAKNSYATDYSIEKIQAWLDVVEVNIESVAS